MSYYIAREVELSHEEAVDSVTEELKAEGFGVLTTIDVRATLKAKLDVDFPKYVILGTCNPPFAHQALILEERIGLVLPCNVIVRETEGGGVKVAAIDPLQSMQAVNNAALGELGTEVREKLSRVIDRVGGS
jgi:uncharacterized protein (DUF302 family)